jgi:hypothetical protein
MTAYDSVEVHLRALRQNIDSLSAKVDSNTRNTNAILTCLREEIEKKTRRREKNQLRLLMIFATVGWFCLIADVFLVI